MKRRKERSEWETESKPERRRKDEKIVRRLQ